MTEIPTVYPKEILIIYVLIVVFVDDADYDDDDEI